jgi:SecD/SecF fusion protein
MAFMQATFSLPGLAGLALTIGMAVDANVLVFERMREEKERGASLAQQIRNGFNRAWITIFDSHVTNLLAAIVLYAVGTEEVKGFALTMIIGMLWNLYTAVFMSRVIFETAFSRGWIKQLRFLKMWDKTNIDFIGPRYICMAGSMILIVLGLIAFFARGRTMYNIDFTGGTLVTIRLNESDPTVQSLSESKRAEFVRQTASVLPDVTVESLRLGKDTKLARFNIRTTATDQDSQEEKDKVKNKIIEAFGPALAKVEMTVGEAKPIPGAAAGDASKASPALAPRFAGGREYPLSFNTTAFNSAQAPAQVVALEFTRVLEGAGIANPTTRFEISEGPAKETGTASTDLVLRTDLEPDIAKAQLTKLKDSLASNRDLLFERITIFGGTVASETRTLALIATVASWVIIIVYLWWRFHSFIYGLAAVLAVVHDVLITLGAIALSYWLARVPIISSMFMIDQFKIDLPMVAAFLTLIGFSTNDTIVIFDRIREIKGKTPHLTIKMVNDAINQTLSRTILTSMTAWLVVVILYILGGEGLHGFAFALVVGFLSGTYSTVYIATPILIDWVGTKSEPAKTGEKKLATAK